MKILTIEKIIIALMLALVLFFCWQLWDDYSKYSSATEDIENGYYSRAAASLSQLDCYRDADAMITLCELMGEYEPACFTSVYHCYRGLEEMADELTNKRLYDEFERFYAEVEALYYNYNISLSVKEN